MRLDSQFDYIPRYFSLGKLDEDAAVVALQTEIDEKLYYNSISRDVNFRFSDYSGVLKQGKRWLYFARLFQDADERAVERIESQRLIFQEMTHDGIQFFRLYQKAFGSRLKFIHILRNPINNIYEQHRRNFGVRFGKDPRELQLCFEWENHAIPIMALGYEDLWVQGNPLERLVVIVEAMFRKNIVSLKDVFSNFRDQIIVLEFERFVQYPDHDMVKIQKFVGESFGNNLRRIMKREKVPRLISASEIAERVGAVHNSIGITYKLLLDKMMHDYEEFVNEMYCR